MTTAVQVMRRHRDGLERHLEVRDDDHPSWGVYQDLEDIRTDHRWMRIAMLIGDLQGEVTELKRQVLELQGDVDQAVPAATPEALDEIDSAKASALAAIEAIRQRLRSHAENS